MGIEAWSRATQDKTAISYTTAGQGGRSEGQEAALQLTVSLDLVLERLELGKPALGRGGGQIGSGSDKVNGRSRFSHFGGRTAVQWAC